MKTRNLIFLFICLVLTNIIAISTHATYDKDISNMEDSTARMCYIEEVLPKYLSVENNHTYGILKISDPITIVNGSNPEQTIYFILNDDEYIARLSVSKIDNKYISSFVFDNNDFISSIIKNDTPFALIMHDDSLIINTKENNDFISLANTPDTTFLSEIEITRSNTSFNVLTLNDVNTLDTNYYVSLDVDYVANTSTSTGGLCWAAAAASVINYHLEEEGELITPLSAVDIFNDLYMEYEDTPIGNRTWYNRAFDYYGLDCTYTTPLDFENLYATLLENKPIIFSMYHMINSTSIKQHAIVLRYIQGIRGNEAIYGFIDSNDSSGTVYVFVDPTLSPSSFVYTHTMYDYEYDEWLASIY